MCLFFFKIKIEYKLIQAVLSFVSVRLKPRMIQQLIVVLTRRKFPTNVKMDDVILGISPITFFYRTHLYCNMITICLSGTAYHHPQIRADVLVAVQGTTEMKPEIIQDRNISVM